MTAGIKLPDAIRAQFVAAGKRGGKKSKELVSHEDHVRFGKLGGRPRKSARKGGTAA